MSEVLTTRGGAVLTITLNRPDVFNAFNRGAARRTQVGSRGGRRPGRARAVVITGAGRGFSAGQDLREFSELQGSLGDALEATYHPNIRLIRGLAKPVVAAVNGPAAGAGLSLASACDVRVASSAAAFVPGFVGIGLVPDSGGSCFLHRLLGCARVRVDESNRRLDADEALAWGLVSEVIPSPRSFDTRVAEIGATWAAMPTLAVGGGRSGCSSTPSTRRSRSSSHSRRSCSRPQSERPILPKESARSSRSAQPSFTGG